MNNSLDHFYDHINDIPTKIERYFGPSLRNSTDEISYKLIERALTEEHSKEIKLKNMVEYTSMKEICTKNKKAATAFDTMANKVYLNYVKDLNANVDNYANLLLYKGLMLCKEFYNKEAEIANKSLKEYISYLKTGHCIAAFFGEERDLNK